MKYLDLFSGIGGFALGAYNAGWRFDEHYFSEVDKYAIEVYRRRFPDAIPLGDITKVDTGALANNNGRRYLGKQKISGARIQEETSQCLYKKTSSWFITGGFPCQDISIAGKGAGIGDSRSGLWFEMWRIIRELRPRWVIAENVGAITFRGLADVVNSLTEIGYDCEWQDIRASDMGAPHRRERIWIVAYPHQSGESISPINGEPRCRELGQDVVDANSSGFQTSGPAFPSGRPTACPMPEFAGKQNGEHYWWPAEPGVGRVVDGLSKRVDRLKCLGNSIVPQIAELLFRQIKAAM